ncbi:PAS domain-containing sensor histidine kinase [Bacillus wiedmannii]|uniref:histidine kinase n=5 Tax=Bacillus cereus group TaxID=86661 RepID=A0A1C4EAZ3_BACTU|nr:MULTISPECIES: PAS domain-containing sensor histidine kinase [Bacillus]MED3026748.1 ATP-binding protein [Bacillus wiedmannii]OTY03185.1 PAS domain-containing sensor histidine kinase [Bacillus thuringiensis serovar wratislaviensis]OUB58744.1 PAS domain-containing sensor histidine kinase [Bacillus thuringiensis serovar sylvestriensis]PDZ45434.1 PAS domain-containing sensor histidine kinase [Bacillus wiedmannii]PEJ66221.1 PAS domain-containing sensor histidine kinase [Bacillus wiedmannii]
MNARLMELIDVSTIETMAEQFYKLTNISHQLLDAEKECIFSFGINEMKICKLPKIEIPIFLYNQHLGSFVVWSNKSDIFNCQKYFEMLSNLIIDGATKIFQSKNSTLLSRKEEELHTILQNMPVMVDALDYNGDFVLWNRECEIVTGYTAEEIIGNPHALQLLYPDHDYRHQIQTKFLTCGKNFRDWEMHLTCKNGETKTIMWSNISEQFPVKGYSYWAVGVDITHLKAIEEQLKQQTSELELIFKALPDLCFLTKDDGTIIDYKAGSPTKFYVPAEAFMGKKFFEVLPSPVAQQFQEAILQVKEKATNVIVEYPLTINDSVNFFEARCLPLLHDKIMIIVRDITERKKTEELLNKSDTLAAIGQLAAGVAHEVRNPLTVIKGFIQLFQINKEDQEKYFDLMLSEIDRIEAILQEFLSIAKTDEINTEQKNIYQIYKNVVSLMNTKAIMTNIQVELYADTKDISIECSENQLKQVFINILQNSIEAMPDGGKITIHIKEINDEGVIIHVIDEGIGIPEERIKRLGEPFYSTKEKGTGIGLMLSYKIIESHQGKISIMSEVGVGTTVTIYLPKAQIKKPLSNYDDRFESMRPIINS